MGSGAPLIEIAQAARRWAKAYRAAWLAGDVDAAVALYASDAVHRSHPFREPNRGLDGVRRYTTQAFADESSDRDVWFGEPIACGDRAAVEYWATFQEKGEPVTLAGCCMLTFDRGGLVTELDDYWTMRPGRVPPYERWGR